MTTEYFRDRKLLIEQSALEEKANLTTAEEAKRREIEKTLNSRREWRRAFSADGVDMPFMAADYFNRLRSVNTQHPLKNKDEAKLLARFLAIKKPTPRLLYWGIHYFNLVFFKEAQTPVADLTADEEAASFLKDFTVDKFQDTVAAHDSLAAPLPDHQGVIASVPSPERADYVPDKEKLDKLMLVAETVEGNVAAQKLIQKLIADRDHNLINIFLRPNDANLQAWLSLWDQETGLPLPGIPPLEIWRKLGKKEADFPPFADKEDGSLQYLDLVSLGRITRQGWLHNAQKNKSIVHAPRYDLTEKIYIDVGWREKDSDMLNMDLWDQEVTPFMKALGLNGRLLDVGSRQIMLLLREIKKDGSPVRTQHHIETLKKLGFDPARFQIRLITVDEYIRLAVARGWGKKSLWTGTNDYLIKRGEGADHDYCVGHKFHGGASAVGMVRNVSYGQLIPRLVIAPLPAGVDC